MKERILTSEQVASILQVHPFTVLKYIKQGKLKGSKLGRMYRIRESEVESFLNKQIQSEPPKISSKPKTETAQDSATKKMPSKPEKTEQPEATEVDTNYLLE